MHDAKATCSPHESGVKPPHSKGLVKQGIGVGFGVEGDHVVDFFAGADKTDRQFQFAGNGHDDAALGGAVELGEDDSGDADGASEFAGLRQAVLPGGGVQHQQHLVRSAGNYLRGSAFHFFQFGHQVGFGMQAAGGVHDDDVSVAGLGGGYRVIDNRSRVRAKFLLDHLDAVARSPNLQLLDGRGAKGVGGAKDHAAAFLFQAIGELADAGGFARAVDADDEDYTRACSVRAIR